MKKELYDIDDNEIRIISNNSKEETAPTSSPLKPNRKLRLGYIIGACVLIVVLILGFIFFRSLGDHSSSDRLVLRNSSGDENIEMDLNEFNETGVNNLSEVSEEKYVVISDTVIDGKSFSIFTPYGATPRLQIGLKALDNSNAIFIVEAADVRADNGEINGAYVSEGKLISRGQSKAGYCAIIDGKIYLGVIDSTPYLEQAIETGGYFFRQFPMVVSGQVVDNDLKLTTLRKALCEINGRIAVVMTHERMTINEFSSYLVKLGVANAIRLIGGDSYGFAILKDGEKITFGDRKTDSFKNVNYIEWM